MIDLDAIRARDQSPYMQATTWLSQSEEDRRALLAYVDALRDAIKLERGKTESSDADNQRLRDELDALREAAGRVTCALCEDSYTRPVILDGNVIAYTACPDCASLRALLSPAPSTPTR